MRPIALVLAALALLAGPAAAQTPTVDELLAKNTESRGGAEKLRAIDTRKVTGGVTAQTPQGSIDISMVVYSKRPNLMLQEMQVMGNQMVTAFDGTKAWGINPMTGGAGPQELTGFQAELLRDQAWFDGPLALARSRNDPMEVAGKEAIEGTMAWKVVITHEGRKTTVYLDEKTALERKVTSSMTQNGVEMLIESIISDYQPADGIMVPRKVQTLVQGQPQATVSIETVAFNVPIDDAKFMMPAK
jgi:outer membrane lipoprotein-sorting protein